METSIPAAIVAAILMVSAMVLARSGYRSVDEMGQLWKELEARAAEQVHTGLTITNVTSSSPYVDADLRNDGSTTLAEYDRMDVIVQYVTGSGAPTLVWIPYTSGPLANNTWIVQGITNDAFEPGILNPGETLRMRIWLDPPAGGGSTNRLLVATDLGVTISTTFTG
jgi:archaellum component FlaF (FlaF/FlaG flagellin family)